MSVVVKLYNGDMRCENLLQSLKESIYEQAANMPIPLIIGTLEILKHEIIKEQE